MTSNNPSIYVVCTESYEQGQPYGVWLDATQGAEELEAEIDQMLFDSPSEDYGDWEIREYTNFCGVEILFEADPNLAIISRVARFIVDTQEIRNNCQCFDAWHSSLVKYAKRAIAEYFEQFKVTDFDDWLVESLIHPKFADLGVVNGVVDIDSGLPASASDTPIREIDF